MIMIPTIILNEDTNSKVVLGDIEGFVPATAADAENEAPKSELIEESTKKSPSFNFKYIFKRGSDMKFHFGFLKRRHSEGNLFKNNKFSTTSPTKTTTTTNNNNNKTKSSSSVRPSPADALKWSTSFMELMSSKYGQTLFKVFLARDYCEENIEFWLAVEDFHKTRRSSKLKAKAAKILNEFIVPQAPKEINLDSLTRDSLINQISHSSSGNSTTTTPITLSTFDQAQKRTQSLLEADAYQRFLKSELYLELIYPEKYLTAAAAS